MRELICGPLCRYHKPGKAEQPGCGGLVWLQGRPHLRGPLAQAAKAVQVAPDPAGPLYGLNPDDPRLLHVCAGCEYREGGCDFRNPAVPRDQCAPCGGLRAVAGLLAAGHGLDL
jgi:hypothetical protein